MLSHRAISSPKVLPTPFHVLIVDDQKIYRRVIGIAVKKLGWTSSEAPDGETALILLERETFDVVFLDWELPRINGAEVIRQARERLPQRTPLIIITSAHSADTMSARWIEAGADGWITGTLTSEAIQRAVSEIPLDNRPENAAKKTKVAHSRKLRSSLWQEIDQETIRLKDAANESRFTEAAHAAHNLRGLASLLGASPLVALAEACEHAAHATDLPALQTTCRDFAASCLPFIREIPG